MLDKHLVAHCSPTLAGLKSANIFNYSFKSIKLLEQQLELLRADLRPKGVSLRVLRRAGACLLFWTTAGFGAIFIF